MTIAQTKAGEMAYRKVMALKSQFYRKDLQPADDYKGSLMDRGKQRRQLAIKEVTTDRKQQEMLKIAKIASDIEQGFKRKV